MRLFYLICAIVVSVFILILSFAQAGGTCTLYLFGSGTSPVVVLLEMAIMGGLVGGLLVAFWKAPKGDEVE